MPRKVRIERKRREGTEKNYKKYINVSVHDEENALEYSNCSPIVYLEELYFHPKLTNALSSLFF